MERRSAIRGGGRDLKTWGSHGDLKIWAIFMV